MGLLYLYQCGVTRVLREEPGAAYGQDVDVVDGFVFVLFSEAVVKDARQYELNHRWFLGCLWQIFSLFGVRCTGRLIGGLPRSCLLPVLGP